jgi:hypothetical protein
MLSSKDCNFMSRDKISNKGDFGATSKLSLSG